MTLRRKLGCKLTKEARVFIWQEDKGVERLLAIEEHCCTVIAKSQFESNGS